MRLIAMLIACLLPLTAHATPVTQPDAQVEIRRVIEDFRMAIIDKDKPRFMRLFMPAVAWQSVTGDATLQRARLKQPAAAKVEIEAGSDHVTFIDNIVKGDRRIDETFDNVRIDTDGDVASVWFGYQFRVDGAVQNSGKEAWHLLRTDDGWKIVSVVWSRNRPAPAQQ